MPRAFVTGGSGFVGGALIDALCERGYEVNALVRSDVAAAFVVGRGATAIRGDLDDHDALRRGAVSCDVVFHSAAIITNWGNDALVHRVNVRGTENVLEAARWARVPRLVHVSSEAVLSDGAPLRRVDETRPRPSRPVGLYAITKGLAEDRVLAANSSELTTVICRPRLIWGEGDNSVLPFFAYAVNRGLFRWFDHGHYLTSTCHVRNVVAGLVLAAEKGRPGSIYFLTDGAPIEFRAFLTALLATRGLKPSDRSMPRWFAVAFAFYSEFTWRLFGKHGAPPMTRSTICLLGQEVTVDDDLARKELGYVEVVSRAIGLRELAESSAQRDDAGESQTAEP